MTASVQTHRLGREAIHTFWDNALPPRLTIAPGDTVVFDTLDASYGRAAHEILAEADDLDPGLRQVIEASRYPLDPEHSGGHPLTGPVAVEGAEPGDTLAVEILEIAPTAWGWTGAPPRIGLLGDEIGEAGCVWDLRDGHSARSPALPGIRVPLRPFCGVMGVAPGEPGRHPTFPPRRVGGNMDIRQLTAGATLYLPIETPGALFSVGDAHGAQGDGEVSGTGIEMAATVTLRFDLLKSKTVRQPRFRTGPRTTALPGPYFATTGHDPDLREAAREALRGMLDYLEAERGIARPQGYLLASVCIDLKISQIVDLPNYTVSAFLPLSIFDG